jgi:ABC-type glycerol-3-phosphate transport system substrate-binding protein
MMKGLKTQGLIWLCVISFLVLGAQYEGTTAYAATEVTWLSHTYEPWNNALADLAKQYMEANQDVKIVYSYVPHADLNTKIATSLAAGDPATIMGVYGPWLPQLLQANALAPAPAWVLEDLDANFPAVMKEAATYDGNVYGYVQHIGIVLPIVNVEIYEEQGITPPSTYDELLAINETLDKPEEFFYGTALANTKGGSWNMIHYAQILFAYGGNLLNTDLTKAAFNSPEGIKAAEIYQKLAHVDASPGDALILRQTAMIWNGPWTKSNLEQNAPDLQYRALPVLQGPAAQVASSYVWFWVVSASASPEEQEAAWRFLQWLSAPDQYEIVYRNVGLVPITKELPADLVDDEWVQAFSKALEYAKIYYSKHPKWEQIDVAIGEELERLVGEEITAEEFAAIAEKKVNAVLAAE